ncbi:hypothetical protein TWF506_000618 [Arthrobotrys conoides]|uniref:Uncharacterized protein n=1 Tax=Arthrobotrys conoides TaxID=74498 RepID=A0AAN8NEB4_9PEZI
MDVSLSKNLVQTKRRRHDPQDTTSFDHHGNNMDMDEPIEEIYHLTLSHFYSSQCVSLLQRSMGELLDKPLAQSKGNRNLKPFVLNFNRQDQVKEAGSLRNYIILGCRPTYPFALVTFLRQVQFNPFDLWQYDFPEPPYPTNPASILYWDLDVDKQLLKPRLPVGPQQPVASTRPIIDLDLLRIHSAWDIQRDQLVQIVVWCNSTGLENRVFELRYGDEVGSLEILKDLEAYMCFCGCGLGVKEDAQVKIFLKSGMLFWFPYEKKTIPEKVPHLRYIRNEYKSGTPFIYLDLSARTKQEMQKYIQDTKIDIRAIDLCVLDRQQAVRFKNSRDHASWYSTSHVLFLFAEWSTRKIFHITYQINGLDMTVETIKVARLKDEDRRRLAMNHTHDCTKVSADLPVKHYPKWSCSDQSLSKMILDELGLELKLDFLPNWHHDLEVAEVADARNVSEMSHMMQNL